MTYQKAAGYNNAGGLTDISIQPASPGLTAGRRQVAGNRQEIEDGRYTSELVYGYLTKSQYNSLLTEFGLTTNASAEITIRMPRNSDREFANYNAVIVRPDIGKDAEFRLGKYLNVRFRLRGIQAI